MNCVHWAGTILSRHTDKFGIEYVKVKLQDPDYRQNEFNAEIDLSRFPESEREHLVEGTCFTWKISESNGKHVSDFHVIRKTVRKT